MSTRSELRRCAIYTRKSSEEGLDQAFNSLHAQREACEAYVKSQRHEGWDALPALYDDGGFSGGTTARPGLQQLLDDVKAGLIDIVLVYKVDRLSRSLADFVRLVELFDANTVSFVSVTQQFNTSTSMGRLTLNVLLSFAQFEREVTGERIRDKIAASKQKGMWMGGVVPLGYDAVDKRLVVNAPEAEVVQHIYQRYLALKCVRRVKHELDAQGYLSKARAPGSLRPGGRPFSRGALYALLKNPLYIGKVSHRGQVYPGAHDNIINESLWNQVRSLLTSNRNQKVAAASAKYPSLLKGLVVDDRGNAMSPTYTRKGNRHYAYYVSQAVTQYRDADAGSVARVPSQAIEEVVINQLATLLGAPSRLIRSVGKNALDANQQARLIAGARAEENGWPALDVHARIGRIQAWVSEVSVARQAIDITISLESMIAALIDDAGWRLNATANKDQTLILTVPVELRRSGIETKLVISNGPEPAVHQRSVKALQVGLLKGLKWNAELVEGVSPSIRAIAERDGVCEDYVQRLRKLAFLAPDIIEAVIEGNVPDTMTLDTLHRRFPLEWVEQRRKFLGAVSR